MLPLVHCPELNVSSLISSLSSEHSVAFPAQSPNATIILQRLCSVGHSSDNLAPIDFNLSVAKNTIISLVNYMLFSDYVSICVTVYMWIVCKIPRSWSDRPGSLWLSTEPSHQPLYSLLSKDCSDSASGPSSCCSQGDRGHRISRDPALLASVQGCSETVIMCPLFMWTPELLSAVLRSWKLESLAAMYFL